MLHENVEDQGTILAQVLVARAGNFNSILHLDDAVPALVSTRF